ncbi:MAG: hypothetical protein ABFS02_02655 [Pseudomonadota bacterium]
MPLVDYPDGHESGGGTRKARVTGKRLPFNTNSALTFEIARIGSGIECENPIGVRAPRRNFPGLARAQIKTGINAGLRISEADKELPDYDTGARTLGSSN